MRRRAGMIEHNFEGLRNIRLNKIQGGIYGYAKIDFSKKAIEHAGKLSAEEYYCD